MKTAERPMVEEPSYNLLDVLGLIVMTSVHEHICLRSCVARKQQCHSPIGDISVIKSWFERLIFDQQSLFRVEAGMHFSERLLEPFDPITNTLCSRVI